MIRFVRQPARIVATLATPLLFWFFIGGGVGRSFGVRAAGGESYSEYLLPGMIALSVMFTAIFSAMSLIDDRSSGFLQSALVSPVSRATIVLAKVLSGAVIAFLQGAAILAFGLGAAKNPALAFLALAALAFALSALGFALAWFSDTAQTFHAIMNGLLMPLWATSGALFAAEGAAAPLSWIVRLNPLSPFIALLRAGLSGGDIPVASVGLGIVACIALAFFSVRRTALAVASVLLLVACEPPAVSAKKSESELSFTRMRLTEFDKGKTRFFAQAARAEGSMGGLDIEKVHVEHRGTPSSDPHIVIGALTIDAARGKIEIDERSVGLISFDGGVSVKDSRGRKLVTEKLTCSFSEQHLSAPGHTTLESPGINASAEGVEGNLATQEFTLSGPIRGTIDPDKVQR
jgi:ABC-2 type transport system permease protein